MTNVKATSKVKTLGWIKDFNNDPPLHAQFPLKLVNGKTVPGVHVVCSSCHACISGDRVHGRVIQSLAHVVTVSANGYCEACDRITHIDFRFRANANKTVIEWLAANGRWQAKEMRKPTLGEKISRATRHLFALLEAK